MPCQHASIFIGGAVRGLVEMAGQEKGEKLTAEEKIGGKEIICNRHVAVAHWQG